MVPLVFSVIVSLSLVGAASADAGDGPSRAAETTAVNLDVPYVPQDRFLCGGAAVAMVLRYWGAPHVGVDEFAALVDRPAHGIETDVLVRAVNERRWRTIERRGSVDLLQSELRAGHPTILLIEDRPQRYHYVVVVGGGAQHVVIHDPTWGPSRTLSYPELTRRWASAEFWSLVILPGPTVRGGGPQPTESLTGKAATRVPTTCDDLLTAAVDRVEQDGLDKAESIFQDVRARCPASAAPLRELAGVRFSQDRWKEASNLAERALSLDRGDSYAWDLLGSSRFLQDDLRGALRAWNEIGKPRVDVVRIDGLTRTQYALVAETLQLSTGSMLTAEQFQRAERRLEELPGASSARLGYRPQPDGFAVVEGSIVEASAVPRGAAEWAALAIHSAVDREIVLSVPGVTGQGETWSAGWRWWNNRPRVSGSFAAPQIGILPGVWRVDASWQRETFRSGGTAATEEERIHGALTVSDWLTSRVRYELAAGMDAWNHGRFASAGGSIERRAFDDRLSLAGGATTWIPLTDSARFDAAHMVARFRSVTESRGTVWVAAAGVNVTTARAPMGVWEGAGEGQARSALARAHPLLSDGVITGPVFGRQLTYGTGEIQHWLGTSPVRFAVAGFVDIARASRRLPSASGDPFQVDTGVGVRIKGPAQKGTLRVDFGTGLRDGAHALTFGWQY